jgi:TolB-like protein/DNA-binding winged helix-turn-helix (wHTH) protein/Flp pilus assembly protein TadD
MSNFREKFRFRDFELDVAAYELRRNGRSIRLERQPMDVLILLVERRGLLVSREDIVDRLWGKDVFVDVETGVHTAIRKIRQALRDSREEPVFVETITGKGYRFIAAVEAVPLERDSALPLTHLEPSPAQAPQAPQPIRVSNPASLVIGLLAILIVSGFVAWRLLSRDLPASQVTLAVLPFENFTGEPEREYLADGLAEETIATVGQVDPEHVSVIGRTSIMVYKHTTKSLAEIGRELGAHYLLESSLRAEGGALRVTSKLIRARDQLQVWSAVYDREPSSMLELQRELSAAIAEQVRFRLSPDRLSGLVRRQTQNAEAYDAYLKGRYLQNRRTRDSNERAVQQYEHAIALDPNYALAWAGLAFTYGASVMNSDARPLDVWAHARDAAAQAVRANPNLAEAQFVVGYMNWIFDWNWKAAEAGFRQAIRLDPGNASAHRTLGHALSQSGRQSEAESEMDRTRQLDPFEPLTHSLSSQVAFQGRDYSAAIDHARRAISVDSELWIGYMQLGQAYERLGNTDLALEALTDAASLSGGNSKAVSLRGYLLAKTGRAGEAREVLRRLEALSRERYVPPYAMAIVYAGLGEQQAVFDWLDKAYAARDVHLIFLPVDPKWDPYRRDSRFEALLARCGFAQTAPASQ